MKLQHPIDGFTWQRSISQLFGVSRDVYYPNFGIPGHNGIDIVGTYGQPIRATHDGRVVGVSFDKSRTRGMGVVLQGDISPGIVIQTTYWHFSQVNINYGQVIKAGQIIGLMGNTGFVNPPPSATCPFCGTHLHFAVSIIVNGKPMFDDYKTFQDPVPFLFNNGEKLPLYFSRDLFIGKSGDDVSWLQTCMALEGYAKDYTPIGQFGGRTRRDVIEYQKKNNINPLLGYVGSKTRTCLNSKYSLMV